MLTEIASTLGAIGYSGMGYATPGVKMLRVSAKTGGAAYEPNAVNTISGAYPISRPLYLYTLGDPAGPVGEYLRWILSPAGQRVVEQAGYVPVGGGA